MEKGAWFNMDKLYCCKSSINVSTDVLLLPHLLSFTALNFLVLSRSPRHRILYTQTKRAEGIVYGLNLLFIFKGYFAKTGSRQKRSWEVVQCNNTTPIVLINSYYGWSRRHFLDNYY